MFMGASSDIGLHDFHLHWSLQDTIRSLPSQNWARMVFLSTLPRLVKGMESRISVDHTILQIEPPHLQQDPDP